MQQAQGYATVCVSKSALCKACLLWIHWASAHASLSSLSKIHAGPTLLPDVQFGASPLWPTCLFWHTTSGVFGIPLTELISTQDLGSKMEEGGWVCLPFVSCPLLPASCPLPSFPCSQGSCAWHIVCKSCIYLSLGVALGCFPLPYLSMPLLAGNQAVLDYLSWRQ